MTTSVIACQPGESSKLLNRLPQLAEPVLQFDLLRELQELRLRDSWQRETGRSSKTLAKYPDFRIVLILMKARTQMDQHRAEGRISIHQLLGKMRVHLPTKEISLSAGELLMLDCGVLHDIEALEESGFLLTISWGKVTLPRPPGQSAEHRLDQEALSRMDDEGGSLQPAVSVPERLEMPLFES